MANHSSALKRVRSSRAKYARNRYLHKTTRTFIKKLRASTSSSDTVALYKKVSSMLDRLVRRGVIHKNKAANQKSRLSRIVQKTT